ncbi:THUMP domain-containing protein 1 [Thoreauomyces humboldtii]|nr:THUMP domain-containing protein 1 [Thoreauomyces humboldtii]
MGKRTSASGGAQNPINKKKKILRGLFSGGPHKQGALQVDPGMQGIYCFVTMDREVQAVAEMKSLLEEYLDTIYGPQENQADDSGSEDGDVSDMLNKELKQLKAVKTDKKQQFQWCKTNMDCIIFLRTHAPIEPSSFVHTMLKDLESRNIKRTRYTQRLHPVQATCRAYMADIKIMAEKLLAPHFKVPDQEPIRWAIEPRIKWNDAMKRDELIKEVAAIVGDHHTVNLTKPELTVVIDVYKNICAMSVVRDYPELGKYNLEKVFDLGVNAKKAAAELVSQ